MKGHLCFCIILLTARLCFPKPALPADLKNQLSLGFSLNDDSPSTPRFSLRCQPSLSLDKSLGAGWKLDSEISLAASASASAPDWSDLDLTGRIKPYRLWLRFSSSRFEARLGLQKLNFGSAMVFRPLMWFDALDPRDPLQVTNGVYGLLLRYYFKSNANVWFWGLYGNHNVKGWETQSTAAKTLEFGGRFQVPMFSGEAGLTVHQRRLDAGSAATTSRPIERRFALDGKWDVGVGLWTEASLVHQDDPAAALPWQCSLALGVDYTFKLGNGLYLLAEQYFSQSAPTLFSRAENGVSLSALMARYPISLLDNLSAVFYYDWEQKQTYNFINWQRTYDRWQFHAMLFWNPGQTQASESRSGNKLYGGRGFQLMAVWNI